MPPVRAKCHPFLRGGASPRSRGEKKYFNIYLKVSAGNGNFPLPLLSPIGLWKSWIRFRAVFRVFSVNEHPATVESMILPRRSNSRIRRRKGKTRAFFFSKKMLLEWTNNLPRRNSISLSGVGCEVWARWRRGKIEVVTLGWIGRSLVDRFRQGRHRGTKSYYTR